jgi:hypothetical protein
MKRTLWYHQLATIVSESNRVFFTQSVCFGFIEPKETTEKQNSTLFLKLYPALRFNLYIFLKKKQKDSNRYIWVSNFGKIRHSCSNKNKFHPKSSIPLALLEKN